MRVFNLALKKTICGKLRETHQKIVENSFFDCEWHTILIQYKYNTNTNTNIITYTNTYTSTGVFHTWKNVN